MKLNHRGIQAAEIDAMDEIAAFQFNQNQLVLVARAADAALAAGSQFTGGAARQAS